MAHRTPKSPKSSKPKKTSRKPRSRRANAEEARSWRPGTLPVGQARPETKETVACPHFGPCGGCTRLDVPYREELSDKVARFRNQVEESAARAGVEILPILAAERPLFYRMSMKVPFGTSQAGPTAGFFQRGSHKIVDLETCVTQDPRLTDLVRRARTLAAEMKVPIYQEYNHRGLLRHLVARVAPGTDELLAGLVVRRSGAPPIRQLADALYDEFRDRGMVGIVENRNPLKTNVILGDRTQRLRGRPYLEEESDGLRVRTSLTSFVQVNPEQASVLYAEVARELAPLEGQRIVDLFAGFGPIGLRLAKQGAQVLCVERNPGSVRDGERAVRDNELAERVEFVTGDADAALAKIGADAPVDALVVDPPRRGLNESVIESLCLLAPARLVYVSCNPETLLRDLEQLARAFRVVSMRPVDLFPRTDHLEVVVRLDRRDG